LLERLHMRDEPPVDEQVHGEPERLAAHREGDLIVGAQVQSQR
jgi:hypothetical protein